MFQSSGFFKIGSRLKAKVEAQYPQMRSEKGYQMVQDYDNKPALFYQFDPQTKTLNFFLQLLKLSKRYNR